MTREPTDLDAVAAEWGVEPVLAVLAEAGAASPPASTRARLVERVASSPRAAAEPMLPADLYAARAEALRLLLDDLGDDEWHQRAAPYVWTVHGLLAHLLVIERYTAAMLGLGAMPAGDGNDHLALGGDVIAAEIGSPPADTARRWWEASQVIAAHVRSDRSDPNAPLPLHGWPFSVSTGLVARAFELWTHHEDICRAAGRVPNRAAARELRTMSSISVASLPFLLPSDGKELRMQPTRVVLTGPGGGTFDIGGPGERAALLVADVVDYCRVVARRIEPEALERTVEGDAALVDGLLSGSCAFAV